MNSPSVHTRPSERETVNIYVDGPNLLGAVSDLRAKRVWIDPVRLAGLLIQDQSQRLGKIYYAETPYHGNLHNPDTFRKQQSFFGRIHKHIRDGRLVHIEGNYRIDTMRVPAYIVRGLNEQVRPLVESLTWVRPIEKGGDVGLAVQMVRDACLHQYDRAILVAADQDYAPAVKAILGDLKKQVSISYVQNTRRNAVALRNRCGQPHFIQITRRMIDTCEFAEEGKVPT
jgi:uncharacterized LabA/DUF88 family protein